MRRLDKISAFTIIELLFVIAIIGVIAAFGMSLTAKSTETAKINKTALQIKQLLEAGLTYYAKNEHWPPNNTSSAPCTTDFCHTYIPLYALNNPWGGLYHWTQTVAPHNPNLIMFKVYTTTEATKAQRIKALLPNAKATIAGMVSAQVAPPGGNAARGEYVFGGSGIVPGANPCVTDYKCPHGYDPHVYAGLGSLASTKIGLSWRTIQSFSITDTNTSCVRNNLPGRKLDVKLKLVKNKPRPTILSVTYVVVCRPHGSS